MFNEKEYNKKWREKNKVKLRKQAMDRYKANPELHKEYTRKYRLKLRSTPEGIRYEKEKSRLYNKNRKTEVFNKYGGCKCALCNNVDFDVLVLDHITGGGTKQRKELYPYSGGNGIYRWVKNNNFPSGFRVLCLNCNWKEHLRKDYGYDI